MTLAEQFQPMLDKRLPAALLAAFLLQTAGALFWAGSAAERIATLERTQAADQSAIARVAVLEDQITTIKQTLDRIEGKLDRVHDKPQLSWPVKSIATAYGRHPVDTRDAL